MGGEAAIDDLDDIRRKCEARAAASVVADGAEAAANRKARRAAELAVR